MRSEIWFHLFAVLLSIASTQSVEPIRSAAEEASSPLLLLSPSTQPVSEPESETISSSFERNFPLEKPAETIAPRERGFPLPEIKPARELGAPSFPVPESELNLPNPSSTLPFAGNVDSGATTVADVDGEKQSVHHKDQNETLEEIEKPEATGTPQLDLMIDATTITGDKIDAITEAPKHEAVASEEDTLPPEVAAADPFATTFAEASTALTATVSEENSPHEMQNNTDRVTDSLATLNSGSDVAGAFTPETFPTGISGLGASTAGPFGTDNVNSDNFESTTRIAPPSLESGNETATTAMMDGLIIASEISSIPQEASRETEVTVSGMQKNTDLHRTSDSEEHTQTSFLGPIPAVIMETIPHETTAADVNLSEEHGTEIPSPHSVTSHTFDEAVSEEQTSATRQSMNANESVTGKITAFDETSTEEHHAIIPGTESISHVELVPSIAVSESITNAPPSQSSDAAASLSAEIEHERESSLPRITTTFVAVVPTTTNRFDASENDHEQEHDDDHDHEHDDESLFVGDKTLFSQDNTMKALQDLSTTRPLFTFSTSSESGQTTEENFGVPGFSRVEGPGPEATEEAAHQPGDNVASYHTAATQQPNIGPEARTIVPVDFAEDDKEPKENHGAEGSQTTENFSEENGEPKDISVIDGSSHVHSVEEATHTVGPTIGGEPKAEPGPEPEPQPEPEPEPGPVPQPEPTPEPEPNTEGGVAPIATPEPGSEENTIDSSSILHTHHTHVTDSGDAREGAFKTPFSFRITSIDYTPEFGDPESGKYKKLRDQLLPDLEEIFGSIFGHAYEGVHLVSFLKGSVIVDGIVYTSTKPDDMEQLATEFEQQVTAKNSEIGGNEVDPRSISLNGYVSKNYIERVHEGYTSGSTSSYIVGGGIAIGILAILLIAFAVIAMNNRRTNGTLKLKEENIAMAESGRSPWQNATSPVNLMGYGNGRSVQGGTTTNGQPPMVTTLVVNDENSR